MKKALTIIALLVCIATTAQSNFEIEATTWTSRYNDELSGAFKDESMKMTLKMNGNIFALFGGVKQALIITGGLDRKAKFSETRNTYYSIDDDSISGEISLEPKNGTVVLVISDKKQETITITLLNPVFKQL